MAKKKNPDQFDRLWMAWLDDMLAQTGETGEKPPCIACVHGKQRSTISTFSCVEANTLNVVCQVCLSALTTDAATIKWFVPRDDLPGNLALSFYALRERYRGKVR